MKDHVGHLTDNPAAESIPGAEAQLQFSRPHSTIDAVGGGQHEIGAHQSARAPKTLQPLDGHQPRRVADRRIHTANYTVRSQTDGHTTATCRHLAIVTCNCKNITFTRLGT